MTENIKRRTIITRQILQFIKNSLDAEIPLKDISERLSLGYSTIKRHASKLMKDPDYIKNFKEVNEIKKAKDNSTIKNEVASLINFENNITQNEIKEELRKKNINISQPTVSRVISDINYSRKRLTLVPVERNSAKNIDARRIYSAQISNLNEDDILFLDESGFNRHISRHYGYSPNGQKAHLNVRASRGRNISLLAVISKRKCIAHKCYEGAINSRILADFIREELPDFTLLGQRKTLVMDNAKFHHSDIVKSICAERGINILYLPPYSPQLNPIENFFSIVKSKIKASREPKETFNQMRSAIANNIVSIELEVYPNLYRSMRNLVLKAAASEIFI